MKIINYIRLIRLHKPNGILLLWWPISWSLWIANYGHPSCLLILVFLLGTIFTRSAGCVINDIIDRNIDFHVERTKNRPLTSGKITLIEAFVIFIILLFLSYILLSKLHRICFYYSFVALCIMMIYPFCKRIIIFPQLILSIAYSLGIPMVFSESYYFYTYIQNRNLLIILLIFINILWTIVYDIQYSIADYKDDINIGIKSLTILIYPDHLVWIKILQIAFHANWIIIIYIMISYLNKSFLLFWTLGSIILIYQNILIKKQKYSILFTLNNVYGLCMWISIYSIYL